MSEIPDTPAYNLGYALAVEYGIETAVEMQADMYDSILPGLGFGDVLRTLWADIRRDLERTPAWLSQAAHELEFYGGRG